MLFDNFRFVVDAKTKSSSHGLIFESVITTTFPWQSETDGILGLAPYTINDRFPRIGDNYNWLKQMKDSGAISRQAFSIDLVSNTMQIGEIQGLSLAYFETVDHF